MYWIYSMLRKSMKEKCHVAKDFNFLKDYTKLGIILRKCPYFKILPPYLSELDFSNSPVWNFQFDELDFFPSLNLIFVGYMI